MVEDESNSLFTYLPYTTLSSFSDSSYQPLFDHEPTQNVLVGCEGDPFCAFDTTVTGSMSFGKATLSVVREEGGVVELAAPGEGRGREGEGKGGGREGRAEEGKGERRKKGGRGE